MFSDNLNKAIFIDKDGTLINDVPYNVNPQLITISNNVIEGLKLLKDQNFLFIVISNQSGVVRGFFKQKDLEKVNKKISELLKAHNVFIDAFYYCPHHPEGKIKKYAVNCDCRKPAPGLILKAANDFNINLTSSWMIGDILNDIEAGNSAGCKTILINNGNETEWLLNEKRKPFFISQHFKQAAEIIISEQLNNKKNFVENVRMEEL
ncbi:MAG: D-glycero-alpha-D-manno-heptose-1,7-bisphosphate 7-phosphatase [Chitinophagaceae bacterium]